MGVGVAALVRKSSTRGVHEYSREKGNGVRHEPLLSFTTALSQYAFGGCCHVQR